MTLQGTGKCRHCGKRISGNKDACGACAGKPKPATTGCLEILNIQGGDTKIVFDNNNVAEVIRAKRIITDMLRRGYALIVEVDRDGEKRYERVQEFDETKGEYIIADLDLVASDPEEASDTVVDELSRSDATARLSGATEDNKLCKCGRPAHHRGACKGPRKSLPMESTKATAIGRSAGGD